MAYRTWGRLLLTALGVSVLAGAGQLGIAYGFGIVRLTGGFTGATVNQWPAQLVWVGWFAANAAVAGAVLTERLARRDALPVSTGRQLAVGAAAALGATAIAPLCMQPARAAELVSVDPVFAVGICAVLGAVVGAGAAIAVLLNPPLGWNAAAVAGAIWLFALVSALPSLGVDGPLRAVRLGVLEPTWLATEAAQRLSLILLPLVALLAGAATAGLARWRGQVPLISAATGVAGPVLVAFAYLTAGPGDPVNRYQTTPYYGALIAVAAGALGATAAALLRWPTRARATGAHAIEPSDILRPLPAGPALPTAESTVTDHSAGEQAEPAGADLAGRSGGTVPATGGTPSGGDASPRSTPAHWDWPAADRPAPTWSGADAENARPGADLPTSRLTVESTLGRPVAPTAQPAADPHSTSHAVKPTVAGAGPTAEPTVAGAGRTAEPTVAEASPTAEPTAAETAPTAGPVGQAGPDVAARTNAAGTARPTAGPVGQAGPDGAARTTAAGTARTGAEAVDAAASTAGESRRAAEAGQPVEGRVASEHGASAAPAPGPATSADAPKPPRARRGAARPAGDPVTTSPTATGADQRTGDDPAAPDRTVGDPTGTGRPAAGDPAATVDAAAAATGTTAAPAPKPRRTRKPRSTSTGKSGAATKPVSGNTAPDAAVPPADAPDAAGTPAVDEPTGAPAFPAQPTATPAQRDELSGGPSPHDEPSPAPTFRAEPIGAPAFPAEPESSAPAGPRSSGDPAGTSETERPSPLPPAWQVAPAWPVPPRSAPPSADPAAPQAREEPAAPAARARHRAPLPDLNRAADWEALATARRAGPQSTGPQSTGAPDTAPSGPSTGPETAEAEPSGEPAEGATTEPTAADQAAGRGRGRLGLFRRGRSRADAETATESEPLPEQDEEFVGWVAGLSKPVPDNEPEQESGRRSLRSSGRHHRD
ncbi:hypothetical protein [Micromonospora sp. NPDC051006]|uniref:hypothetical protein n=1 Tax=Micromonospora sp. NPDC051006 TaxID=3364283 RepID=UPI00379C6B24